MAPEVAPPGCLWSTSHKDVIIFQELCPKYQKKRKRKDYAFRRQFNEKPSITLGCPGLKLRFQLFRHWQSALDVLCDCTDDLKLLFGEVSGLRPPGCPWFGFNDVALRDCEHCHISKPHRDAQTRLLWKDKTRPACT